MDTIQRIVLGVMFFALVAAVVKWKRPTLWAKLTRIFRRKE